MGYSQPVNSTEVLALLKKAGKPQTAAIYKRHGSGDNVFGVLTSEIAKLQKKIKVDHALALELWKTGNAEARILAMQIADPEKLSPDEADELAAAPTHQFTAYYLCALLARSSMAPKKMGAWMKSRTEAIREAGFHLLAHRLKLDPVSVSDAEAEKILQTIEREIHGSPNRARHTMNGALIAIGVSKPSLRKKAIDAAKRIGKVEVDHGETDCTTPEAAAYIEKAAKRKK
jgi:3-methyladenine DNA glycosylase AlkD